MDIESWLNWGIIKWLCGDDSTESSINVSTFIIWLAPWEGKMNEILRCDWLPERTRWSYVVLSGVLAVSSEEHFPESHINPLLIKLVRSRYLDIGLVLFFANIGQYSAVLTLSLVNNPYILGFLFLRSAFWLESVCRVMSSYRGVFQIQRHLWKDLSKLCLWHDHDHQFSLPLANFFKALFSFLSYDSELYSLLSSITYISIA